MTHYPSLGLNIQEAFQVCPPYPSTLELCKLMVSYCSPKKKVLDIGTGTGIIAIYLSKIGCEVTATDTSKEALKLARENSQINNVPITLIQSDIYSNIQGRFHLVIFAIPYIFSKNNYYGFISYLYSKIVPSNLDYYISIVFNKAFSMTDAWKIKEDKILKFLKETPKHLTDDGLVFIIILEENIQLLKRVVGIKILKKIRSKSFPEAFIVIYHYED